MASPLPRSPFPISRLRTKEGKSASPEGREALYAIFHTECVTSELAWRYLERLRRLGEPRGLPVVGVSQDPVNETAEFAKRVGVEAEMLFDAPPWPVSSALGVTGVPTLLLVDSEGRLVERVEGFQKRKLEDFAARSAELSGRDELPLFRADENVPASRPG